MSDAAFIAYMKTPDKSLPLEDNTSGCLINMYGAPNETGSAFFHLLAGRVISENLLEACRFIIDRGRENNGYERLNFTWTSQCVKGDRLFSNAYARYGVDAVKKIIFKRGVPLPQANTYIKIPMKLPELSNEILDFVDMDAPFYSIREPHPIVYKDPCNIALYNTTKIIDTQYLWLYLIDPFNEEFHIAHAEPFRDLELDPPYFNDQTRLTISYQHLSKTSLKSARLPELDHRFQLLVEESRQNKIYVRDSTGRCRVLRDRSELGLPPVSYWHQAHIYIEEQQRRERLARRDGFDVYHPRLLR